MSYKIADSDCLKTDLYQLTMAAGYFENSVDFTATFEMLVHGSLKKRNFLIVAGIEQCLKYIQQLRFSEDDIKFLKRHPSFKNVSNKFFDYLRKLRFAGDVYAVDEGSVVFGNEPIIRVTAPIVEAQILETYLLSTVHIQTLVASKAVRVVNAGCCDGTNRGIIDFGSRRAHGPQAAIYAARAAYIGGCIGTSNVYAGRLFGIPTFGTMAHSWVEAFDTEDESFRKYLKVFPQGSTLLIDTYNTIDAANRLASLNKEIKSVRIDSGDLLIISRKVRQILDKNGLKDVKIIASGNLNEYKIERLVKDKAPIDIFGVGTDMVTSKDEPSLNFTYKLVNIQKVNGEVIDKAKFSSKKATYPGKKQVFRKIDKSGKFIEDIVDMEESRYNKDYMPLLKKVVNNGMVLKITDTHAARAKAMEDLKRLDLRLYALKKARPYPVKMSNAIVHLSKRVRKEIGRLYR